jgi:hypothetical protein
MCEAQGAPLIRINPRAPDVAPGNGIGIASGAPGCLVAFARRASRLTNGHSIMKFYFKNTFKMKFPVMPYGYRLACEREQLYLRKC